MRSFAALRSAANLSVLEAGNLLGVDIATITAYETSEKRPRPRDIQILMGLARIETEKVRQSDCESEARQVSSNNLHEHTHSAKTALKNQTPATPFDEVTALGEADLDLDIVSFGDVLREIRKLGGISAGEVSQIIGASLISVVRWERGDVRPGTEMTAKILALHRELKAGRRPLARDVVKGHTFSSRGARVNDRKFPLFRHRLKIDLLEQEQRPLIHRLKAGSSYWGNGEQVLRGLIDEYNAPAKTAPEPAISGVSAGKNTYTYDAHTYHTKVPPQGIAQIIEQYLPNGGLILDPFAGSGMTGVAARATGYDVILNELSPAASFIADRFTRAIDPNLFAAAVRAVCEAVEPLRNELYQTECRECRRATEILYTVWSYKVTCPSCQNEFTLWDECRKYGRTVREHKILSEFPCPACGVVIKKSRLKRTYAVPVMLGYKCCRSTQIEHPLTHKDRERIDQIDRERKLAAGFFPTTKLPDGVNLGQPKRHGLVSVDQFYTTRNLSAMSHLWQAIHRIDDADLAGFVGFAFTSLYQRVTRLSEYRFWGGSGNTANFNVPYIFNEANVFATFERKARTIEDHLETTARHYRSRCVVKTGSATNLDFLPENSIDLIFTDPPFGANINYSEMNILWESWLGDFTDTRDEAIVNKFQAKDAVRYGDLMQKSLTECYRVLRPGHWMLLVFMNSSEEIWRQLRRAVSGAGFSIDRIDIFDKQHGTFKQFVSENTAGCDLILHCRKVASVARSEDKNNRRVDVSTIARFLKGRQSPIPKLPYLHVNRSEEIDYRMLYSEWLADSLLGEERLLDFASFKGMAAAALGIEPDDRL